MWFLLLQLVSVPMKGHATAAATSRADSVCVCPAWRDSGATLVLTAPMASPAAEVNTIGFISFSIAIVYSHAYNMVFKNLCYPVLNLARQVCLFNRAKRASIVTLKQQIRIIKCGILCYGFFCAQNIPRRQQPCASISSFRVFITVLLLCSSCSWFLPPCGLCAAPGTATSG